MSLRYGTHEPIHRATAGRIAAAEILLIFLVFFVHAGWPVPDVNEAHYLGKAKHYWNPDWCAGDFFLESTDAHLVFYWLFGWLTLGLPLPAVAWLGRLVTWALLAWAWRRLSVTLVPQPLVAVLSAGLFVALIDRCNFAGEWVVGGVEAKGFAYVCVLLGLAAMVRGCWNRAWLLLGLASALHVIVGGWSTLLVAFTWILEGRERPKITQMAPGLAGGFALALFGLVPAVWLSWGGDPATVAEANQIYVFRRLPHHLAPFTLASNQLVVRWIRYAVLVTTLALMCLATPASSGQRRLRRFVLGAVLVALAGWAISVATHNQPRIAAAILRYYWFRLSDVAVPLGFAQTVALAVAAAAATVPRWRYAALLTCALAIVGLHLGAVVRERSIDPFPRSERKMVKHGEWLDVCRWVKENVPEGKRCLTPRLAHTFKWRSGRPEVANYKDIPQDAVSIVEWWRRMRVVYGYLDGGGRAWGGPLARRSEEDLTAVARDFHAEYLVTRRWPKLRLEKLYRNGRYAVYRLPPSADP